MTTTTVPVPHPTRRLRAIAAVALAIAVAAIITVSLVASNLGHSAPRLRLPQISQSSSGFGANSAIDDCVVRVNPHFC